MADAVQSVALYTIGRQRERIGLGSDPVHKEDG